MSQTIRIFQVDAFATRLFAGNPAAVCPLDQWLPDEKLQSIAIENNLSETAFLVPENGGYRLRWFTPGCEVSLCGHATLASAWVLWNRLGETGSRIAFQTLSGELGVDREGDSVTMSLPSWPSSPCPLPPEIGPAIGAEPVETRVVRSDETNYILVFESEEQVRSLKPDFGPLSRLYKTGVIVTAPGDESDFSSRYFAPAFGIDEDPVTGAIHCALVPYWSQRLGKKRLQARQVSARGGDLDCRVEGGRIIVSGRCVLYMEGTAYV